MKLDRRQFNQGAVAAAVAAAIPVLPTPPQVKTSRYLEQVPIEGPLGLDPHYPMEFEVQLLERGPQIDLYQVQNLTDLILRIEGKSRFPQRQVYLFELGPRATYQAAIPSHWDPRFHLVSKYRMVDYRPCCDCEDGPHGTWCSNRNVWRHV